MKDAAAFHKSDRLLRIYSRLIDGEVLNKKELARRFHVTERSIQRDLESLRSFLKEQRLRQTIVYDKKAHGYCLERDGQSGLSGGELLTVCRILLESGSMPREEMLPLMDKLIVCCVPARDRKAVTGLIAGEWQKYPPPPNYAPARDSRWETG